MNKFINKRLRDFNHVKIFFHEEINHLRVGRATAALLDKVLVNVYGANSPLNAVSSITVQDARSMVVSVWDKSLLKDVEKGIVDANLGLGVINEGDKIRVTIPVLTEENRKKLVKQLHEEHEKARIAARKVRDDIKNDIEKAEDDSEITEDEKFQFIEELDKTIANLNEELKEITEHKEKDIMTI